MTISSHVTIPADVFPAEPLARFPAAPILYKCAGILIAAVIPAGFWTAALMLAGKAFGFSLAPSALMITASTIAVFLSAVCASVILRNDAV